MRRATITAGWAPTRRASRARARSTTGSRARSWRGSTRPSPLADVIATVGTVCSADVTHEELRPLLAGYAAGTLDEAGCEAVRVHLASGCVACLHDVFDRPVGLPRTPPGPPAPAPRPASAARQPRGLGVLAVGLGLVLAALGVRTIGELRGRQAGTAARVAELEPERGTLSARVAALEHDAAAARPAPEAARAEALDLAQA